MNLVEFFLGMGPMLVIERGFRNRPQARSRSLAERVFYPHGKARAYR